MVHTAVEWSSAWIQSRTFSPLPYSFGAQALEDVGDLARDELLHVLVGAVVVRAVARSWPRMPKVRCPGAHEQVGARLRSSSTGWTGWYGVSLRELGRIVQSQVAVDLVGGDVVVAHVVLAGRLQAGGTCPPRWSSGTAPGSRSSCRCATRPRSARSRHGPERACRAARRRRCCRARTPHGRPGRPLMFSRLPAYVNASRTVTCTSGWLLYT